MDNNHSQDDTDASSPEEKYARLEDLLRETLALAAEIASAKGPSKPTPPAAANDQHRQHDNHHVPGTNQRKASTPASGEPAHDKTSTRHNSTSTSLHDLYRPRRRPGQSGDETEQDGSPSASSSAVQEPFSPGSLALSLDAIVEGKKAGDDDEKTAPPDLCCLGDASRIPESPPQPTRAALSRGPVAADQPDSRLVVAQRAVPLGVGGENVMVSPQSSPRWQVRIIPVPSRPREPISCPPEISISPAVVKLEAVLPYRLFSDGNSAPEGWGSEDSYIIIGPPPMVCAGTSPAAGDTGVMEEKNPLGCPETERDFQTVHDMSLQDLIDDWEYAAGTPEVEDAKSHA